MIVEKRIREYLLSLEPEQEELYRNIREAAERDGVPIIKRDTAALLKAMIAAKQPRAILEVGTAVGYSALLMAGVMSRSCTITTIEKYEPRIAAAEENFKKSEAGERITLLKGDAEEILQSLAGPYDFIFMDAAKGQYLGWLPELLRLLPAGGVLFSDNVLQDGTIVESRFAVERRDRTIHARMREYLWTLKHTEELETAVVPIGDGAAISVKRGAV